MNLSLPASRGLRTLYILLLILLGVASILGIGVGVLSLASVREKLGSAIAERISERSGLSVSCGSAQLLPGSLRLYDLRVAHRGVPLAQFESLELSPDLNALLSGRVLLKRVTGNGYTITLPDRLEDVASPETPEAEPGGEVPEKTGDSRLERLARFLQPEGFELKFANGNLTLHGDLQAAPFLQLPALTFDWPTPGKLPVRVSFDLAYPEGDGELGVEVSTEQDGEGLSARILGPGFPLEPLRAELLARLPESLQLQLEPLLAHVPTLPTLGGDFKVSVDRAISRVEIRGEVDLREVVVLEEHLATLPFGPLELSQDVQLELLPSQQRLTIERWDGRIGRAAYQLEATVEAQPDAVPFHLKLEMKQTPYQALVDALPGELVPAIGGVKLGGELDLKVEGAGDLREMTSVELSYDADWSRLTLVEPSLALQGAEPLKGFVYRPFSKDGVVREIVLGRDQPYWVTLDQLPNALIQSLLLSEDSSFYQHEGFDTEGLRRALESNLKAGKAVRGGSTITQQLAKNLFLSRERTLVRKLQEALLAWELEKVLGKRQILETYLNVIEWGPGIYGIRRASEHYFGKEPFALSIKEAAYLCTIIPNPIRFYYYFQSGVLTPYWESHLQNLLDRLRAFERIGEEEYQIASEELLSFRGSPHSSMDLKQLEAEPDPEEAPLFSLDKLQLRGPGE